MSKDFKNVSNVALELLQAKDPEETQEAFEKSDGKAKRKPPARIKREVPEHLANLFTLKQVEEILGVHRRTVYRYIHDGKLNAVKVGFDWRVSQKALEDFVAGKWRFKKDPTTVKQP